MSRPEVAVILLNWNQAEETLRCLASLKTLTYPNYRVIVVDNGSRDASAERIARECPWAGLIRNERNLGFAQGCNVGIRKALEQPTPYLLFLNNDAKPEADCLTCLVEGLEGEPKRGILGAVNYDVENPGVPWTCGHRFIWWRGALRRLLPPAEAASRLFEVQSVSGSCFLVRRELFEKIGLFDRRFFIYYEETDFCLRAEASGFKVLVHLDAKVWHKGSNTFGRRSAAERYLFTRNHLFCLGRHCPKGFLPTAMALYLLKQGLHCLLLALRGRLREASAILVGVWDAGTGRLGVGRLRMFSQKGFEASDE